MEKFEEIQKLQELKEKGAITEVEFETEKSKILNSDNVKDDKQINELTEKKVRIVNVIYGVMIFFLICLILNGLGEYARNSGVTSYYIQARADAKKQMIIYSMVSILVTVIYKWLISYFRKDEK